jgi:aspartyl-tRNA(Asn)/glutamyl-tRNA(Gln) amidotransferase subunit B
MKNYKTTIGLEIHAELKTNSKMFCGCKNAPHESEANVNICPICMGYPGTLPVINKKAVESVLRVGAAVNGNLADFTEFDRKNYFYPDIPKGYQISQYKFPLVSGGELAGVKLTRIHLEEDTARSSHDSGDYSLVDYNRAGVPLMELVTEPVIHSAEEAMNFAKELQLLLQYLGVSDANMEKGEMRVEVNISVAEENAEKFGTKVEVKNINSFRAAGKAIEYETKRHIELLESGEKVVQETRGWDENKGKTFSQRSKENAHDYRYFPEPDLPKLIISEIPEFSLDNLKKSLPELPSELRQRFSDNFKLKSLDIETYINNVEASKFFQSVTEELKEVGEAIQTASNYITSDLLGFSKNVNLDFHIGKITPSSFAALIKMIKNGEVSSRGAKDILKIMWEEGGDPMQIANEKGLIQKSDPEELKNIMSKIISDNPKIVEEYKAGKESVLQFFVGQGMKATKGSAKPQLLQSLVKDLIKN